MYRDPRAQRAGGRTPWAKGLAGPATVVEITGNTVQVRTADGVAVRGIHWTTWSSSLRMRARPRRPLLCLSLTRIRSTRLPFPRRQLRYRSARSSTVNSCSWALTSRIAVLSTPTAHSALVKSHTSCKRNCLVLCTVWAPCKTGAYASASNSCTSTQKAWKPQQGLSHQLSRSLPHGSFVKSTFCRKAICGIRKHARSISQIGDWRPPPFRRRATPCR